MQLLNSTKSKGNLKKISALAVKMLLLFYILTVVVVGSADYIIPDKVIMTRQEVNKTSLNIQGVSENYTVDAKLFGVVPIKEVQLTVIEDNMLIPCGNIFGIKFFTKGVMVINLAKIETKEGNISPAKEAGLEVDDVILSINGKEVNTVEEMASCIENSHGDPLEIVYTRKDEKRVCILKPHLSLSDKKYKTGIWVRDSTAGIGTMTYYNPKTGNFAGLGHGICDVDTGSLMPLLRGSVVDVTLTDVIKGRKGSPGELKGDFDTRRTGVLTQNSPVGVFGVVDDNSKLVDIEPLEIGLKNEVEIGEAQILCEVDKSGIEKYDIEITKIEDTQDKIKNFVVKVKDQRLIEKTGGIVQGMSGSPIIQNGKIVGAVTHVFVNDPTRGYGIFIENMLAEAEK